MNQSHDSDMSGTNLEQGGGGESREASTVEVGRVIAGTRRRTALISIGRGPGDPRAMCKEARSLADSGYEVTYVCNAGSGPMVTDDHVRTVAVRMSASRLSRQLRGPGMMLREALRSRPDVIHVFDPALIGPALRLKRRHGVKVVVDLAEDNAKQILQKSYLGSMATRRLAAYVYTRASRHWLPQADLVITATPSIARSLPAGCRHVLVRNFPAIAEIDAVAPLDLPAGGSLVPVLRVAYVGGISPIRGVRELVTAAGILKGAVELHLAGQVFDNGFLAEMESVPGWQYCHYHGWLNWQDSIALVKACDVGACIFRPAPNQVEALPVKVFEYMACRRGSMVSWFPLWRRLFAGAALFVDPEEPASIARLMERLAADPELLSRLGGRGRLLAETRYSWESEARQLIDGYGSLWTV